MACRLFGAKPLFEPMLDYSQLNTLEQMVFEIQKILFQKMHLKISFENVGHFVSASVC